jgi:hypothetical protein
MVTAIVALVAALLGGGIWSFASTWLQQVFRRGERDEDRREREHRECLAEVRALKVRLDALEHHHASLVPRWIKDSSKRVQWVNGAAMLAIFGPLGHSREDVEGHTFADLLDAEAAREIDRLDRSALARPGTAVSTLLQLHLTLRPMHIVKVAGVGRDNELIYEGYAYCTNDPADLWDRGTRRQEEQLGLSQLRTQGPASDDSPPPQTAA